MNRKKKFSCNRKLGNRNERWKKTREEEKRRAIRNIQIFTALSKNFLTLLQSPIANLKKKQFVDRNRFVHTMTIPYVILISRATFRKGQRENKKKIFFFLNYTRKRLRRRRIPTFSNRERTNLFDFVSVSRNAPKFLSSHTLTDNKKTNLRPKNISGGKVNDDRDLKNK